MANMRALRTRIKSAQSTGKITKSMKMVSAAKLRKTQSAMQSLRPYAEKSGEILSRLVAGTDCGSPFLTAREVKKTCYVLFVGNRGLCGVYNTAMVKYFRQLKEEEGGESTAVIVGRWGRDMFRTGLGSIEKTFEEVSDTPDSAQAIEIAEYLKQLYLSGKADRIVLVYSAYKSALSQVPTSRVLLPVEPAQSSGGLADYIFEPDRESLINSILELYINNTVFSALLEAKTGEHASRMSAMTAATDNTEELIADLSLKLNHARQAAITTEITEIVGGAAALNS